MVDHLLSFFGEDLALISTDPVNPQYECRVCKRQMGGVSVKHLASQKHLEAVARYEAQQAAATQMLPGLNALNSPEPIANPQDDLFQEEGPRSESPERPPTPLSSMYALSLAQMAQEDNSDDSDLEIDVQKLTEAIKAMDHEMWGEEEDETANDAALEEDLRSSQLLDNAAWYPFKKKEHIVALLIIGSTRSILSRSQYHHIRSIIHICNVRLPEWGALRALSKRLKKNLGLDVSERTSARQTPLFGLKVQTIISNELANPFVSPELVCLPELPFKEAIDRFSQSQKWREGFSKDLRVPMQRGRPLAKCLPAKLVPDPTSQSDQSLVFIPSEPKFDSDDLNTIDLKDFWRTVSEIHLDDNTCLKDHQYFLQESSDGWNRHPIINPWRSRANGVLIKHIPIVLYSDDTSGNVSKKWNKHMSVFFTLAGLPPKMTNMEYNIHFLATSNCASALDLMDEVVDDLNHHSSEGFLTYDYASGKEVLVIAVVLCHLGDGPMHAEISNTTNPANTLTPCRMCDLHVTKMADKKTEDYVSAFIGVRPDGEQFSLPKRDWDTTRSRTYSIWAAAQNPNTKTLVEKKAREFGLRDSVNDAFVKHIQAAFDTQESVDVQRLCQQFNQQLGLRMFNPMLRLNGFNGHQDTPIETLHVVLLGITKYLFRDTMKSFGILKPAHQQHRLLSARWRAFNTKGLKMPRVQPTTLITYYQSLVGKDFRTILQAVPFVLFDYIPANKRHLWTSLCLLGSFIFQHEISHMKEYIENLEKSILIFYNQLIKNTAQWVNKPKIHMLTHLKHSIERFGPASLCMTEKFECFNGVLRAASVHSNRQSPGRDIANSFNNFQLMRALLSGSTFVDKEMQGRVSAGPRVRELLNIVPELYQAMGLDPKASRESGITVGPRVKEILDIPAFLLTQAPQLKWQEHSSVTLPNGQKLHQSRDIGQVSAIWKAEEWASSQCVLLLQETCHGSISAFYGMREITRTNRTRWVDIRNIDCILNVQHNCHQAACPVTNGQQRQVERRQTTSTVSNLCHVATDDFILNSASHYSAETHREVANVGTRPISPGEWMETLYEGLRIWRSVPMKSNGPRKSKGKDKQNENDGPHAQEGVESEPEDLDWEVDDLF
ncbi:hypothetical protein DFH28DRAFT_1131965 [Melampsora americana]|nr:hypothetical protein DFH28DRAFT_1131965 [Melampsora americana]